MQDKFIYEYAIIRFSPLVERGEFFNIGAILYSKPKKYLAMRFHIDPKKLEAFNSQHSTEELEAYLKAWEKVCKGGTEDRKSTRLNSSHVRISYAVFCLKK